MYTKIKVKPKEPENILLQYADWMRNRYTNQNDAVITLSTLVNSISNFYAEMSLKETYQLMNEYRVIVGCANCGNDQFEGGYNRSRLREETAWKTHFYCSNCGYERTVMMEDDD